MNLEESYDSRKVVYDQIREGYKLLGIPIIDAFYDSGIVPRDMMPFDGGGIGGDSGHPSSYGYKRIAKLIANTIIRYVQTNEVDQYENQSETLTGLIFME